ERGRREPRHARSRGLRTGGRGEVTAGGFADELAVANDQLAAREDVPDGARDAEALEVRALDTAAKRPLADRPCGLRIPDDDVGVRPRQQGALLREEPEALGRGGSEDVGEAPDPDAAGDSFGEDERHAHPAAGDAVGDAPEVAEGWIRLPAHVR